MSELVATLLSRLGADETRGRTPVLLPIEGRQKGPRSAGWQKRTWEDLRDPDYVAQLDAHANTGVLLGEASGGLCTIDCDVDWFADDLLALNPRLAQSLRTRGKRGCQIWFWLKRDAKMARVGLRSYPPQVLGLEHRTMRDEVPGAKEDKPVHLGEWRGGKCQSVIQGIHPDGMAYSVLMDAPPIEITFRSIVWPAYVVQSWFKAWMEDLEATFGPPFTQDRESGVINPTDHFWAGRYALFNDILMELEEGKFYAYNDDDGLWSPHKHEQILADVSKHFLEFGRSVPGMDQFTRNPIRSPTRVGAVVTYLAGETTKSRAFDRPPGTIHLKNGVLDLTSANNDLLPFSPDYYSRNQVPWEYKAGAECPRFIDELLKPALPDEDIELIQRIAGSLLLGYNIGQKIFIFQGTAGGGKSTLIDILHRLIGRHNVANLRTKLLEERFELEGFIGKTCLSAADVKGDFLRASATAMLKPLTGGDFLEAELKGGKRAQLRGIFNVTVVANARLTVNMQDDVDAWRRRLVIITYNRPKVSKPVDDFAGKLLAEEASGILNWALEGARKLMNDCRAGLGMTLTEAQHARVHDLLSESESLKFFVEQQVEPYDGSDVTIAELLDAYRDFCADRGWNAVPDSTFHNGLRELILRTHHCSPAHDIKRTDGERQTSKRGYRDLRIAGWDK